MGRRQGSLASTGAANTQDEAQEALDALAGDFCEDCGLADSRCECQCFGCYELRSNCHCVNVKCPFCGYDCGAFMGWCPHVLLHRWTEDMGWEGGESHREFPGLSRVSPECAVHLPEDEDAALLEEAFGPALPLLKAYRLSEGGVDEDKLRWRLAENIAVPTETDGYRFSNPDVDGEFLFADGVTQAWSEMNTLMDALEAGLRRIGARDDEP